MPGNAKINIPGLEVFKEQLQATRWGSRGALYDQFSEQVGIRRAVIQKRVENDKSHGTETVKGGRGGE